MSFSWSISCDLPKSDPLLQIIGIIIAMIGLVVCITGVAFCVAITIENIISYLKEESSNSGKQKTEK